MIGAQRFVVLTAVFLTGFVLNPLSAMTAMAQETAVLKVDRQNQAAQDGLDLLDQGKYKESWDAASAQLKAKMTADQWKKMIAPVRGGLGERLTRGLDSRQEVPSIKGSPEGKYVIMTFTSSFVNKQQAVETLTLMQDPDGNWRVAAYSIK